MAEKKDSRRPKRITPLRAGAQEDAAVNSAAMSPLLPVRPKDVLLSVQELAKEAVSEPANLLAMLKRLAGDQLAVLTGNAEISAPKKDPRFKDERWETNPYYRRVMQSWLSLDRRSREWLETTNLGETDERRAEFFLNIILGGVSPTNFPPTNPAVIDATVETRGKNLLKGLKRRWRDVTKNDGLPTQVNKSHFEVGKNIGATPGQVIYRTELFELIQYTPTTAKVFATPLLMVGSYINRHYLLDLKPGRSLVEYMVSQGHSVFLIVWRNPGSEHRDWGHSEYAAGVIEAAEVVRKIRRAKTVNLGALCAGGQISTLAACVLESQGKPWINSFTTLVSVLDTRPDDSELGLVCTERGVNLAKQQVKKDGIFKAEDLLWSFNLMQPENLIWNTWVDYYLLGKEPGSSEVMFWMNDQVNLPEKLYSEQLDIMLHNPLPKAGEFELLDTAVDLKRLKMDTYIVAAYYDHIMPWHAVYRSRKLLGGNTEFVMTNGGHITPCITAVDNPRAIYYSNPAAPDDHEEWLDGAEENSGSWLSHWVVWLGERAGDKVGAPKKLGNTKFPPLAATPGTYVFK